MPTAAKPAPSAPRARATAPRGAINLRVHPAERALIDQAATLAGKSRSEFMLDAARRAATDAILDRTLFRLEPATFARFLAALDAPPAPNERLRATLRAPAPWD